MSVGATILPTEIEPVAGSSNCPSDSPPLPQVEPITVEEIIKYYNDDYYTTNAAINQNILANKKRQFEVRLKQLNKVLPELVSKWEVPSPLYYYVAYSEKDMNTDELILGIEDTSFQEHVTELAEKRIKEAGKPLTRKARLELQKKVEEEHEKEEQKTNDDEEEDSTDPSDEDYQATSYSTYDEAPSRRSSNVKRARKPQRCTLPCPPEVNKEEWDTWSDAHKQSYVKQKENPNTYLYRNLPPGETQRNGPWTPEEHRLFLKRLHEIREQGISEGKWGIFSMKIPGRVGYQCANYYRKLLQTGKVHDEFYRKDPDGTLHFKDRKSYHKKNYKGEETKVSSTDTEDEEPQEKPTFGMYEKMALQNPLKKKEDDFITGEPIRVPTISPDGTVLDYNTWLKILTTTKQDPFTLRHINKRQLVILTKENYDDYKGKIKNM